MNKLKVRLKIQNLELEIDGARDDVSLISQNVGHQLNGLLKPVDLIAEENEISDHLMVQNSPTSKEVKQRTRKSKPRINKPTNSHSNGEDIINWVHEPGKWGTPKQEWNTATKSIYILFVVKSEKEINELSSQQITKTFNKHFYQAGTIQPFNVTRDLGKVKVGKDALVGQNTTIESTPWFLTEAGLKHAQDLVFEVMGKNKE
jgi:hypothetical protein